MIRNIIIALIVYSLLAIIILSVIVKPRGSISVLTDNSDYVEYKDVQREDFLFDNKIRIKIRVIFYPSTDIMFYNCTVDKDMLLKCEVNNEYTFRKEINW